MARRRAKVSFNFGWIIFMVIMYNVVFDDDDKTETKVVDQDQRPAIEQTVDKVKTQIIDNTERIAEKIKDEISNKEKEKKDPKPPPKEIMTAEPEKGPDPRPLNTQPESTGGFKKL